MDDCSEIVKTTCCTCLSRDRKLSQLCRIYDGVNNLYMLLSHDSEAYREGFFKESASLFICWECRATICRLTRFREQASIAQRQLSCIADGQTDIKYLECLSQLSRCTPPSISVASNISQDESDNFIDCDVNIDIKSESDEDIPINQSNSIPPPPNPIKSDIERIEAHVINKEQLKKECKVEKEELCNSSARMICQEIVEDKRKYNQEIKNSSKIDNKFLCTECNQNFDTRNAKWRHMQRHHREGYMCSTCDKSFTFKHNLLSHLLKHHRPPARTECPVCHKQVLNTELEVHSRKHSGPEQHTCVECDKSFVSRASYEQHLKYTTAHVAAAILKFKCAECDKGYKSRVELRDHIDYMHIGKTKHKCPICEKNFSSNRNMRRHITLVHEKIPPARNKTCHFCGHAFSSNAILRAHIRTHTGERPLKCELCDATFAHPGALYGHKKLKHRQTTK